MLTWGPQGLIPLLAPKFGSRAGFLLLLNRTCPPLHMPPCDIFPDPTAPLSSPWFLLAPVRPAVAHSFLRALMGQTQSKALSGDSWWTRYDACAQRWPQWVWMHPSSQVWQDVIIFLLSISHCRCSLGRRSARWLPFSPTQPILLLSLQPGPLPVLACPETKFRSLHILQV